MSSKRIIALSFGALFLFMLTVVWIRGGDDYSDGDRAIVRASSLRKGMRMYEAFRTLHPERMANTSQFSWSTRPSNTGVGQETIHALTPDRYLILTISASKSIPGRSNEPRLGRWKIYNGPAPREDVTIGRALQMGRFRFRY